MQRSDAAARRFFGAFYRWSRLTSSAHGAHVPLRRAEDRAYHAAHRRLCSRSVTAETNETYSSWRERGTVTNSPFEDGTSTWRPCCASPRHGQHSYGLKELDQRHKSDSKDESLHTQPINTSSGAVRAQTRRDLNAVQSTTVRSHVQKYRTTTRRHSRSLSGQTRRFHSVRHNRSVAAKHSHIESTDGSNSSVNLRENVRAALRLLTHPVTLITTSDPSQDMQQSDDQLLFCRGVTVSSFTTVTLNPSTVISFNLKVPSRSWDALCRSGKLRVHLLAATPEGAWIAHTFTQPYQSAHEPFHSLTEKSIPLHTQDPDYPPLIGPTDGVLAHMSARVLQDKCVQVGDHVIVVAEVLDCEFFPQKAHKGAVELPPALANASGLAYAAQRYRGQGGQIDLPALQTASNSSNLEHAKPSSHISASSGLKKQSSARNSGPSMQSNSSTVTGSNSFQQARNYSTVPTLQSASPQGQKSQLNTIVDPAARETTVADFFNLPDEHDPRSRFPNINKLLVTEKAIRRARQQLQDGVAQGLSMNDAKMLKLEKKIAHDERRVAKKLSRYAARSLRVMLDKGRVDFKRAQWLESCIERGQAALTSDIAEVEGMFRQGSLDEETFRIATEKLQSDHDALVTESMRLRQIVDEENDSPAFDVDDDRAQGHR